MAIKRQAVYLLLPLLLYLAGWMIKAVTALNDDGTVALDDDDDAASLLKKNISGWPYETPKAHEPPSNISDASFPFVMVDPHVIQENKKHIYDYDRGLQHALWFLKKKADRYVSNTTRLTVVDKKIAVPGNDKHDYMSLARYFWPNESRPDGLPYIRKDGQVNPESKQVADYAMLHAFVNQVKYLALAYHYFDNQTYASKAIERIHGWFIDADTRMNPHMQYASLIRGYNTGRSKGIIDFHIVSELLDSIAILQSSDAWNVSLTKQIRYWFILYLDWLVHSPNGVYESQSQNNHGTYYDIQRASIYLFLNQTDMAKQVIMNATATRIAQQILPSGQQYLETARPLSWFYSIFNLRGLFQLAQIAQRFDFDLFNYETTDGKGIRKALDFLLPTAINESAWTFNNTQGFEDSYHLIELLDFAYVVYQDEMYLTIGKHLSTKYAHEYNISRLTMPWAVFGGEEVDTFRRKHTSMSSPPLSLHIKVLAFSFSVFALSFAWLFPLI